LARKVPPFYRSESMVASPVRLSWERNDPAPERTGRLYPEDVGEAGLRLVQGDNLSVLRTLEGELRGKVTLAYLDPPFFTGRAHSHVDRSRDPKSGQIRRVHSPAFDDRWSSMATYLDMLAPRLGLAFDTLADDGCLVLHVDPKTSHYLKVLCDELFGAEHFASEIVWRYRRWPTKTANFQRVHDVLLRYTKGDPSTATFNPLYEPLAPSTLKTWGTGKQRAVVGTSGRRVRSSTTAKASPGAPLGDVWELGIVAPVSKERTGYPTQKPEALLERLVTGLTLPGDLVLDAFAGSGTTLATAARLGRRCLGIDQSEQSIRVIERRLNAAGQNVALQRLTTQAKQSLERQSA
jgi:site-specific DNA-methyltransferase (adenine-specific)